MPARVAAIQVSHWHSLYDSAYLRHLLGLPDVTLAAVHDPDPAIAAHRAQELGGPAVFTDHRRMLDEVRPDFVIALGRHCDMAAIAHDLLDRGRPFLMEKPMGLDARQVASIAERVATAGTFVAVPLGQRYHPFAAHARRLIAEGRFGPLSHFHFRLNRPTSARYPAWGSPWMLDPALAGGGCLRNLGPHGLDLFAFLTGEEAEVTGAQVSRQALGQPVEDYASVLLRSTGGVLATIEVGTTLPRPGRDGEWTLSGRDALLTLTDGGAMRLSTRDGDETLAAEPAEPLALTALRDALDRWRRGAAPPICVADCLRAVRQIDRAYELAARGAA